MKQVMKFLGAILLGTALIGAAQAQKVPQEGKDYQVLKSPVPTDEKNKIEVVEFFWYNCPHCRQFEPTLNDWVKRLPADIAFKRVHVRFHESFIPQQKLYLALEALGRVDDLHGKVFEAIHGQKIRLTNEEQIADWVEKQGVDRQKFLEVYKSFTVETKASRFAKLQESYRVDGVPMLAVNGQYITSPAMVRNDWVAALRNVNFLIDKARTQKKGGAS